MVLGRRAFFELFGGALIVLSGTEALFRRVAPAAGSGLALRKVRLDDAADLRSIMNGCVGDADSFHGKCDEWSLRWAEICARRHPETVVITMAGTPVAFQDIPSIRPAVAPPAGDASAEELRKYELRERNRRTFYLQAAGVRADVLGEEEAVRMFRRVLYYGFERARSLGYEQVECFLPWEQHPKMARAWTGYPGCELVMRSRNQAGGRDAYQLRWRLDDAVEALALEGADDAALVLS